MRKLIVTSLLLLWPAFARAEENDFARIAATTCEHANTHDPPFTQEVVEANHGIDVAKLALLKAQDQQKTAKASLDAATASGKKAHASAKASADDLRKADEALEQARIDSYEADRDLAEKTHEAATAQEAFDAATKRVDLQRKLCAADVWSPRAGHDYPATYVIQKAGFDKPKLICGELALIGTVDDGVDIGRACGTELTKETAAGGFSAVPINLVLGLGDHLEEQAKEESLEWMLEHVAKEFCKYKFQLDATIPETKIDVYTWFKGTCDTMFPHGFDGDLDVDTFSFGALKLAFKKDAQQLPGRMMDVGKAWLDKHSKVGEYIVGVIGAIGYVGFEVWSGKTIVQIVDELDDKLEANMAEAMKGNTCDFTKKDPKRPKQCIPLLLFRLPRTALDTYKEGEPHPVGRIIQDSLEAFCVKYGPAGKNTDGSCVISNDNYEKWHDLLTDFYEAAKKLVDLNEKIGKDEANYPHETAAKSAIDYADALRGLFDAYMNVLAAVPDQTKDDIDSITDAKKVVDAAFDAFDGIVGDDPAKLRIGLDGLLESKIIGSHLSSLQASTLTTVIALATAKDRAEVKGILDDVLAPVGTYRMKHDADHTIVAINGFVGTFVGAEHRFGVSDTTMTEPNGMAPFRLRAPVGLDITFPTNGNKGHLWGLFGRNLGITITAIDPLALDVTTKGESVSARWLTLWQPGFYIRLGLGKSPFAMLLGGSYVPGRRSETMCGTDRCFDGTFQAGAYFTADVPLWVIKR